MTKQFTFVPILLIILAATLVIGLPSATATAPLVQTEQTQTSEPLPPLAIGDVRDIPCPMNLPEGEVDGETIACGQLTVPENWETPGENKISITYAILKAKSGVPFDEPIIYLEGGPGGSALEDIEKLSGYFSKLRETRDFIYYDQRGTAYSSDLECPAAVQSEFIADALAVADEPAADEGEDAGTDEADVQIDASEELAEFEALPTPIPVLDQDPQEVLETQRAAANPAEASCFEYFQEQGVDLSQYTTANSILDLTALMQALDYSTYNVYGISYGTRLGLELLRTLEELGEDAGLPEIRSVVFDGIDPPHIDMVTQSPLAAMHVTLRMLSDCEANEACGAAYPGIRQRAVALLDQAEAAPLAITSSVGLTETVTLADLVALLTGVAVTEGEDLAAIGHVDVVPYLPMLVDELSNGVGDTYMGLKQGLLPTEAATEVQADPTLLDPLAQRSQQLADEAEALAQELATLAAQAQRSSDALSGEAGLPEFFVSELVLLVTEQASFEEIGAFGRILFQVFATQEPNRETLSEMIEFFELGDAGQATLTSIANLMSEAEVAKAVALVLSDRILEQMTEAIQYQMNYAVLCNDMYAQLDVESAFEIYRNAEAPQLLGLPGPLVTYIPRCENYQLTAGAGEPSEPVVSDLPILVANGGIDVTTPAEWGEAAAEHLPNAQLVIIPMFDHGATAKSECGQDIVRHFFTYPDQEADTSCIEALKPAFILPGDGN